jgi:hypothetical protein
MTHWSELPFITLHKSSISGDASRRADVVKMASFLDKQLKSYGVETKLVDLGEHTLDGKQLKLPPAILGKIGSDPKKKTVLIYGHFDVQPVSPHAAGPADCICCARRVTPNQLQHFYSFEIPSGIYVVHGLISQYSTGVSHAMTPILMDMIRA